MLGLVAAQLKYRCEAGLVSQRPVWVDVSVISISLLQSTDYSRLAVELVTSRCSNHKVTFRWIDISQH